jgi:hypothetical protein
MKMFLVCGNKKGKDKKGIGARLENAMLRAKLL